MFYRIWPNSKRYIFYKKNMFSIINKMFHYLQMYKSLKRKKLNQRITAGMKESIKDMKTIDEQELSSLLSKVEVNTNNTSLNKGSRFTQNEISQKVRCYLTYINICYLHKDE